MNKLVCTVLLASLFSLSACSSSNSSDSDSATDMPVTGEFHIIEPAAVDAYVAEYEEQRARISFTFDGVERPLTFLAEDSDSNALLANFNDNDLLVIGFDFSTQEPVPTLGVIEVSSDGESIERTWATTESISIQPTATEDFLYSGRLKDTNSDTEVDVSLLLNESLISGGTSTISVSGTDAVISGGMGTGTYVQMRDMLMANPQVNRLILQASDGSSNDAINVHTGRLIRAANLATHVPADGDINSGAVDLFTAGVMRTVEPGGILGVHSWCCEDGVTADKLPKSDPAHGTQLTYFREMLPQTGEDFYFFTLQAAPFDGIHPMTREEMTQFSVTTE